MGGQFVVSPDTAVARSRSDNSDRLLHWADWSPSIPRSGTDYAAYLALSAVETSLPNEVPPTLSIANNFSIAL